MKFTRNPIQTYEQAVFRLVQFRVEERFCDEQLLLAREMIEDIYWVSSAKVLHDVERETRKLCGGLRFAPPARLGVL